ncbi:hypothetical protein OG352_38370 [Streptomyces sp. NBC_01485]|uniref:hypothetical protein n=1 Tax=Streptomyces sp. NBC_01485 TaxID=2903884 RepID=UPI002E351643|nr:hypothetical protein [Streptomyces sp. NBC_01485]
MRVCCGWSSWSNGCGPEFVGWKASRRGRRRGRLPQSQARQVPGEETWTLLPQVNRQVAVRWLVVLAARRLAAIPPATGASGEAVLS